MFAGHVQNMELKEKKKLFGLLVGFFLFTFVGTALYDTDTGTSLAVL